MLGPSRRGGIEISVNLDIAIELTHGRLCLPHLFLAVVILSSTMTILPSDTTPFGFIQPLHEYIIAHAFGLTFTNSIWLFIIPLVPLSILNFLVLFPKTRPYRVPLGIIGVGMVLHAVMTYRFDGEHHDTISTSFHWVIRRMVLM